ncbi:hypothetical protein [Micromonospora rifamycinica]|uniref:Flagellar basal body-associated protein FliL n=1 Tax=Micromonospora rifamycinica TaxID=291594 RepID=A0A120F8X7_9ACTN|nr:hypothetical protein [Micromonospora rifamycinica]KWV32374.1 hypothetical protein AWV63_12545 [Micromonospora rifamycinica]SCG52708.1 hypothetical protein GA0070623_2068 [Micromonospora rifamycinica]
MSQPPTSPYASAPDGGTPQGGHPSPQQPDGVGVPQYAGPPPAAPAKKRSTGKIVLIVLAVLLVLCLGGAAIAAFALKDDVKEVVDAANTTVSAPATLAGRPQVTDPALKAVADGLVTEMKKSVQGETSTAGAFYGDPTKQDLLMIAAASGVMADPKKELDDAVAGITTELNVTNMAGVDAGPLGGDARCGDGKSEGVPLGVCVWADKGSVGLIVQYYKSAADLKSEFVTMRGQIEKKG